MHIDDNMAHNIQAAYRKAILTVFGGATDDEPFFQKAVETDVHRGCEAPGQWSPKSILEIYCENGIPNATDMFDPGWYGYPGEVTYNSEQWIKIDNLACDLLGLPKGTFYHEPYNSAVVNVYRG